jgi:hypothetical protein
LVELDITPPKSCLAYPSIEQFRSVIAHEKRQASYRGLDEEGNAIYEPLASLPTKTYTGTVKLHGTNCGVSFNNTHGLWVQSRNNVITPLKDNAGFATFVEGRKKVFYEMFLDTVNNQNVDTDENTVTIFGEFIGKGIQKGVGVSELEKSMFIFGVKVTPHAKENPSYWVDYKSLKFPAERIYNISDYQTYEIKIDFNDPLQVQNKLIELTEEVEKECPVAKAFGISGIGEGIVWTNGENKFKVKGELHSSSKVKILAAVDVDLLESIKDFVNYAVTENRFNQAIENIFPNNGPKDIKKLGDLIKWVNSDIIKEELDTLIKNNLEPKQVMGATAKKVKEMFLNLEL